MTVFRVPLAIEAATTSIKTPRVGPSQPAVTQPLPVSARRAHKRGNLRHRRRGSTPTSDTPPRTGSPAAKAGQVSGETHGIAGPTFRTDQIMMLLL